MRPCEDLPSIRASRLSTASDHGSWGEKKNCGKWAALRIAHKRIIRWTRIRRIQPLEGRTRYRLAFHRGQLLRRPSCGFSRHWRETASGLVKETPALGRTRPGPWPLASRVARTRTRTRPATALRVVKFPAFHKNRRSTGLHNSKPLLYPKPDQSILRPSIAIHCNILLQSYLLTSGYPTKTPSAFVFSLPHPPHSS